MNFTRISFLKQNINDFESKNRKNTSENIAGMTMRAVIMDYKLY